MKPVRTVITTLLSILIVGLAASCSSAGDGEAPASVTVEPNGIGTKDLWFNFPNFVVLPYAGNALCRSLSNNDAVFRFYAQNDSNTGATIPTVRVYAFPKSICGVSGTLARPTRYLKNIFLGPHETQLLEVT